MRIPSWLRRRPEIDAQPPAVPALPEPPVTPPEALSVDPGAVQEPISHVAVVPVHWLRPGQPDAACGASLGDFGDKWALDLARVTCDLCACDPVPAPEAPAPELEPAPVIRKVHYATDNGTSACNTRPASPNHLTDDPQLVTCKRCDRTLW